MADDEKEKEGSGAPELSGDDFLDLFDEAGEVVDESLALLTATLVDVPIDTLMEQVQDIKSIVDQIRNR